MSVPRIAVVGRVATDVQTRDTQAGGIIARFRLVSADRHKDPQSGEWVETDAHWATVKVLSDRLARHTHASIRKGDIVSVTGRLRTVTWTDEHGGEHTGDEVVASDVAASLQFRELRHGEVAPTTDAAPSAGGTGTSLAGMPGTTAEDVRSLQAGF